MYVEAIAIVSKCKANFVVNAVRYGCPRGGSRSVTWLRVFGDPLCTLSIIYLHCFASWGQSVVEVFVIWIVVKHLSILLVALVSFVCPTFAAGYVDGYSVFVSVD